MTSKWLSPPQWAISIDGYCVAVAVLALGELLFDRSPLVVAIGLAMAVALGWHRRSPIRCCAMVFGLALAQVVLAVAMSNAEAWRYVTPLPYDVAVLIAIFSVVKYASSLRVGVVAGIAGIGGAMVPSRYAKDDWWRQALLLGAIVLAIWAFGLTARIQRLYVVGLEDRAATLERERVHLARLAAAEERARIAREVHDVVANSLGVMIAQADGAAAAMESNPSGARRALETVGAVGREALGEMRQLVTTLREPRDPVAAHIPQRRRLLMTDQLGPLMARSRAAGVDTKMRVGGIPVPLSPGMALVMYRITQEALTNVLKHAGSGTAVRFSLVYRADAVEIEVVDDGAGNSSGPRVDGGHGIAGMRERVVMCGGDFAAGPLPGGGWRVHACVPLAQAWPDDDDASIQS